MLTLTIGLGDFAVLRANQFGHGGVVASEYG